MLLVYRFRVVSDTDVQLSCYALDVRKGGKWTGTPFPLSVDKLILGNVDSVRVSPLDRKILMSMMMHQKAGGAEALFRGANTSRVMEHLIACGRAYPDSRNAPPLAKIKQRKGTPGWATLEGDLKPVVEVPGAFDVIPGNPCFALERETGACAELKLPVDGKAAWSWISSPVIPLEKCGPFLEGMARKHPGADFPPPPSLEMETLQGLKPVPLGVYRTGDRMTGLPDRMELFFRYGTARVPHELGGSTVRWIDEERLYEARRDPAAESRAEKELRSTGLVRYEPSTDNLFAARPEVPFFVPERQGPSGWSGFVARACTELDGWEWELPAELRPKEVSEEDWYLEFEERSTGTLKYQQGVMIDGKPVNLLPVLHHFLSERKDLDRGEILADIGPDAFPLSTEHGLLLIPADRLRRMVGTLFELYAPGALDAQGRLSLGVWRAAELHEDDATGWTPSATLRQQLDALRGGVEIQPLEPPDAFRGELRDYQKTGLGWLDFLYRHGLGGILADDMGLGKTIQLISLLLRIQEEKTDPIRALIVCPTSVLPNWDNELATFAPILKRVRHHGPDRATDPDNLKSRQVILTTYGTLLRDEVMLNGLSFDVLALDEAQAIKNPKAKISRTVKQMNGALRLALSGTPLENHLGELRSLADFTLPGYLGTERQFNTVLRRPIEENNDRNARAVLAARIGPVFLRRTKDQVATDLPPKTEIRQELDLTEAQADAYEVVRAAGEESLRETLADQGFERSRIHVLDLLLKLRQACCDPRLLPGSDAKARADNAKRAWLLDVLPEMIEEGRRILLFSQFTSMLDLLKPEFTKLDIPFVEIRGNTRDRETPVKQFQAGKVPLFLISLKAGGTGLNLTAADTVIFHDPWWNPAAESQAADRTHRIGQDKPVFIYKLVCRGTVEERILQLQERKKELGALLSTETSTSIQLTEQDLQTLLAPLA